MTRGELIRQTRAALGLTQWQLGQFIGADPTLVSRWENGRTEPRPEVARKILAVLRGETSPDVWAELEAAVTGGADHGSL